MRKTVCIDSNIFIWGVKQVSASGQEDKIGNAKNFLLWLEERNYDILLPAPMLAEILSPVPPEEHKIVLSLINKRFIVTPFDAAASKKCGELLHKSFKDEELLEYRKTNSVPRAKMKYDCMIASVCIVRKAECIYSNDPDLKKFADGQIPVKDMPVISRAVQKSIFEEFELDKPHNTEDLPF